MRNLEYKVESKLSYDIIIIRQNRHFIVSMIGLIVLSEFKPIFKVCLVVRYAMMLILLTANNQCWTRHNFPIVMKENERKIRMVEESFKREELFQVDG